MNEPETSYEPYPGAAVEAYREGRDDERARIVLWLLKRADFRRDMPEASAALWVAAKLIEAKQPPEM